jgi:hypothetical protein
MPCLLKAFWKSIGRRSRRECACKEQDKKADTEPLAKPFGNLDKLT